MRILALLFTALALAVPVLGSDAPTTPRTGERAFQYAWSGKLDEALREFERARAGDPENYDLRMGEALVTNWMGDHLTAWEAYASIARAHPERSGPWVGMAAAQNWSGRRDRALTSLIEAQKREPNWDAVQLDRSIRASLRPMGGLFYDWSEDSDDYQVNALWAETAVFAGPQLQLVPFINRVGIRRPDSPAMDENWIGLTAASRPTTRLELWGRLSVLANPEEGSVYSPLTATLRTDVTASDRVRFGASLDRFAVVSFQTFPDKITGETYSLFFEGRPDWLSRVRISGDYARYRPVGVFGENHRRNISVFASRQVWAPTRVRVGVTGRYLDFMESPNNGIWTPDSFWATAATLEWNIGVRSSWSLNGKAEFGPAREIGSDTTLFTAWQLGFFRALGDLLLDVSVGHSEGNVDTWTGYDRTYAHVGIRQRF